MVTLPIFSLSLYRLESTLLYLAQVRLLSNGPCVSDITDLSQSLRGEGEILLWLLTRDWVRKVTTSSELSRENMVLRFYLRAILSSVWNCFGSDRLSGIQCRFEGSLVEKNKQRL